ncbi:MAG: DUF6067 family protein [Parabacteroides sp.]|nr:DUF6067 family protein [Parabacteroides sp.]
MKRITLYTLLVAVATATATYAQDVTNAFDDLKRQGTVSEENSEMRRAAPEEARQRLLQEHPASRYFCFTEDRMHDIRLTDALPARWTECPAEARNRFTGTCAPGEFYTWQIGLYAPYIALDDVSLAFSPLVNEQGARIDATRLNCFNTGGTDTDGNPFRNTLQVPQGAVQPLWVGIDVPETASGTYRGKVTVKPAGLPPTEIPVALSVKGTVLPNRGDNEGWRKTRLRWLDSHLGVSETPTAPYIPVTLRKQQLSYLGGTVELAASGLPARIATCYDAANRLDPSAANEVLAGEMRFVIETAAGAQTLKPGKFRIVKRTPATVSWETVSLSGKNGFEVTCRGVFNFDGSMDYQLAVKARQGVQVRDIRLEIPYTAYASRYWMGLGNKGGLRKTDAFEWHWDTTKHQDKIWMGNINAGLNLCLKDERYTRPLVNIYYELGKLKLPASWGNEQKGGVRIQANNGGEVRLEAFSGARKMEKGETVHYDFHLLITPVKPLDLRAHAQERFYHSNSDLSEEYIPEALKNGANIINIHHKKDIYPFINYPYSDESVADLTRFVQQAHADSLKVRVYYTTRELTVKIPELWALRSLGGEVIHDGPGKDARTLIHPDGPNEWLNKNLSTHFIPAWYNAFREGKYAGDMDISVITTPDSRWNNYYLAGLDWMVRNVGIDGVYIDDSALDGKTLQRARRILDADGKRRLVDIHSWNHMNRWAGYANSLHIYLDLLPYVDRIWMGEGFSEKNDLDFWLVEMSGIPFGVMSETLDARNQFRGLVFGMLPRLPWSGNPVPMWQLWDAFGMKDARMYGYWDERNPVKTGNEALPATVYVNGDKALVAMANWTDLPQTGKIELNEDALGFTPSKISLPEIKNLQWGSGFNLSRPCEVMGRSGLVLLLEK